MRKILPVLLTLLVGASSAFAQPRYQLIHVAPGVTASQDSVYICEDGVFIGDFTGYTDALHYGDATPFFGPGSPGTKVFAASLSDDCANIVVSKEIDIAADRDYQIILAGTYEDVENPNGIFTDLDFVVNDHAVVEPTGGGLVDVTLVHGIPNLGDVTAIVPALDNTAVPVGVFKAINPVQCEEGVTACAIELPSILETTVVELHSTAALASGDTTALFAVNVPLGALMDQSVTAIATGLGGSNTYFPAVLGVLTDGTVVPLEQPAQPVSIEFAVDMSVEIATGNFDPENDIVVVAGSMNDWSTVTDTLLPDFTDPNRYSKIVDLDSVVIAEAIAKTGAYRIEYKYVTGTPPDQPEGWESVNNRILNVTGLEEKDPETGALIVEQAEIPTYNDADINDFFANTMLITFEVDMRPAFYHKADTGAPANDVQTNEASTFDRGVWANGPLSKAPGGWADWGPGNLDQVAEVMLHDDGATGGDAVAGDSVYTFQVNFNVAEPRTGDIKFSTDGYDNEHGFEGNHKLTLPDAPIGTGRVELIFGAMEDGNGNILDTLYDPYINRKRGGTAEVVRRGGEDDDADKSYVMAEIEFAVDLSVEIATGNFDPAEDIVVVAGSFNGWSPLADTLIPDFADPTLYTKLVQLDSVDVEFGPDTTFYKYVLGTTPGSPPEGWESVDNREIYITGNEPDEDGNGYLDIVQDEVPTYSDRRIEDFFANDQTIIFELDMRTALYHKADSTSLPNDSQTSEETTFDRGVWANGPLSKAPGGWADWGPGNLDQIAELQLHDDGATGGDAVANDSVYTFTVDFSAGEARTGDLKFGTDGYDNESDFEGNHKLTLPDPAGKAESRIQLVFGAMESGDGNFGTALYDEYICLSSDGTTVTPLVVRSGGKAPDCKQTVAIEPVGVEVPSEIALGDNYPNPFNPSTTFEYTITNPGQVQVMIFDLSGRLVETLVDEVQSAARYRVTFDSRNLASGVYIYQLRTTDQVISKKMLLLK